VKATCFFLILATIIPLWFDGPARYNRDIQNSERTAVNSFRLPEGERISREKVNDAIRACRKFRLDTVLAVFIDMKMHSGKKRLFVYDLQKNTTLFSGLCCHGMGQGSSCASPVFSNTKNSNCTSLGKYRTGVRSYSQYGINVHYKLHGLENSNSNAFSRIVVLHSYSPVPEYEIYPDHLPMGWSLGCPVTSNKTMTALDSILRKKKTGILLWIYQ
jgi:hypothetical protein